MKPNYRITLLLVVSLLAGNLHLSAQYSIAATLREAADGSQRATFVTASEESLPTVIPIVAQPTATQGVDSLAGRADILVPADTLLVTEESPVVDSARIDVPSVAALESYAEGIVLGDERMSDYLPLLHGRRVGVLTNHTGVVGENHLVDTLISCGVNVTTIFAPEHGFRGNHSAGEVVPSSRDAYTGVEIVSLYGARRTPSANDVFRNDVIVVDIQDVGLRYYTYLSTMYLMMQTCAEVGVPMIVLDRPNPNGMYVDGPIVETQYRSFVGMLPIPIVHGMTLGELARMINGEGWLEGGRRCDLTVVTCLNYRRSMRYRLPIAPSPNLPNMQAIYLYPSLCYFEGTSVSVGRGTECPFQIYGHPDFKNGDVEFTPRQKSGARSPLHEGRVCRGWDLRGVEADSLIAEGIDLRYLVEAYNELGLGNDFFVSNFFEKLVGVGYVREMILAGFSAEQIEAAWKPEVERFKQQRKPYLIYED